MFSFGVLGNEFRMHPSALMTATEMNTTREMEGMSNCNDKRINNSLLLYTTESPASLAVDMAVLPRKRPRQLDADIAEVAVAGTISK